MHGDKKTTIKAAASWEEVSGRCLQFFLNWVGKLALYKDTESTEWSLKWKDRKGEDTEVLVKVPSYTFFQCSNQGGKGRGGEGKTTELL